MNNPKLRILAMTMLAGSAATSFAQSDLILNLGPLNNSQIVFSGNTFNFSPAAPGTGIGPAGSVPDQWFISSEDGSAATQSAVNDVGAFSGGPFQFGAVAITGLFQDASVNPVDVSTLYISDGSGYLSGTVQFFDVSTYGKAGGFINSQVLINLNNGSRSIPGLDPDLQFLTANSAWPGGFVIPICRRGQDADATVLRSHVWHFLQW